MDPTPPAGPEPAEDDSAHPVSVVVMRRTGLAFVKGKGHIPDWPMRDLTGPEAAARVPDRATLLSVLATGVYAFPPDPPKAAEPQRHATPQPSQAEPQQADAEKES